MKTALFIVSKGENLGADAGGYAEIFAQGAIELSTLEVIDREDEVRFLKRIREFKDSFDLIVVADGSEGNKAKQIVAEEFDAPLVENENAKRFIDAVGTEKGEIISEEFAMLPLEASVVPNIRGAYQGFILEKDDVVLSALPNGISEFRVMAEGYLFPYVEKKYSLKRKRFVLKYFGDGEKLSKELARAKAQSYVDFEYFLSEKYGDYTIRLLFSDADETGVSAVIRDIVTELKDEIYAEEDKTLGERLFDCLTVKNKKIAVAESFTGGRVTAEIVKNSGASAYLYEGIVSYSNESKEKRLSVDGDHLAKNGAVSSVVAYDMAVGLLRTKKVDLAISTTGIAGPKSDDTAKPVGLCYIAVGTTFGVHTYKFNLKGSREEITETAKNTALFLAIKNLKRM